MSRRVKLLKKAIDSGNLSSEDYIALAKSWGIEVIPPPGGGSHFGLFSGRSKRIGTVPLPASGPVKRCYVKRLVEVIEELEAATKESSEEQEPGDNEQED